MNIPAARKGRIKPSVYTPISRNPFAPVSALPAIRSTLVRAGPTQGVQAKLKAKPMISAVTGDIVIFSSLSGSRCSEPRTFELPKTPSWYSPNRMTSTPPMRAKSIRLSLKKLPAADAPIPSTKNAPLIPSVKNSTRINSFRRSLFPGPAGPAPGSPAWTAPPPVPTFSPPARYPRYSGTSGSTQGEKKLKSPCMKTVTADIPVSIVNPICEFSFSSRTAYSGMSFSIIVSCL